MRSGGLKPALQTAPCSTPANTLSSGNSNRTAIGRRTATSSTGKFPHLHEVRGRSVTLAFLPVPTQARVLALRDESGLQLDCRRWEKLLNLSVADCGDRYTETEDLVEVARRGHFTRGCIAWEEICVQ